MAVRLTEEQRRAVTLEDNIAVTAGAGTGKTSAMTERVVGALDKLDHINQLLVVTFTDDAAGEIRRRVYQALLARIRDSEGAARDRLERMRDRFLQNHISTMHTFFAHILRRFPDRLDGIDPEFRVVSGAEQQELLRSAVESVIDRIAANPSAPLREDLRGWLRQHRRAGVCAVIAALIRKRVEVSPWLREMTDGGAGAVYASRQQAASRFLEEARRDFFDDVTVRAAADELRSATPLSAAASDALVLLRDAVLDAVADEDVEALREKLLKKDGDPRSFGRAGSKTAWDVAARDAARAALAAIAAPLAADPRLAMRWDADVEAAAHEALCALARLTTACLSEYRARKARDAALDFVDLEDLASVLLGDLDVLRILRGQFRAIFIDEFQDTNRHQWSMFRRLATTDDGDLHPNRLFLVGDEKQAIYEFRGGEVEVCALARRDVGETLEFTANFRSAPNLLLFTNRFFDQLLTGEAPYEAQAQALRHGNSDAPPSDSVPAPHGGTVTRILDAGASEAPDEQADGEDAEAPAPAGGPSALEREAGVIATLLRGIVSGEREAEYPGLAASVERGEPTVGVLFRRTTHQHVYEDALRAEGVPYIAARGRGFYRREETRDLRNMLRVLEDPSRDIPLVGVLRSPFIGCSDSGLLLLTARRRYRFQALWSVLAELGADAELAAEGCSEDDIGAVRKARYLLARWREHARRSPVATVLSRALEESGAYAPLAFGVDGRQRVLNVEKFLNVVAALESEGARTLGDLIRYTDAQDEEGDVEGDADMPDGGAIQLLTVHRAKGLEWPMVIVPDTAAKFRTAIQETDPGSRRGGSSRLAIGRLPGGGDAYHVAMTYMTPRHDAVKTFAWTRLEDERNRRARAEQKRLLYVAFTRAKEHLVVGTCDDGKRERRTLDEGVSWMDWIETILADGSVGRGTHPFYAELVAEALDEDRPLADAAPTRVEFDTARIWAPPSDDAGVARVTDRRAAAVAHAALRDDLRPSHLDAEGERFSAVANALLRVADEVGSDLETLTRHARGVARAAGAPSDDTVISRAVDSALAAHAWIRRRFPPPHKLLFGKAFDVATAGGRVVGQVDVVAVADDGGIAAVILKHTEAGSATAVAHERQAHAVGHALAGWAEGARVRVLICAVEDGRVRELATS